MSGRENVLDSVKKLYGDFSKGTIVVSKDEELVRKELTELRIVPNIDIFLTIYSVKDKTIIEK